MSFLYVGIGGFLGSISRYLISKLIINNGFPMGTLTINIVGCFFMGVLISFFKYGQIGKQHLFLFVAVGFLASFTTFSTFAYETLKLIEDSHIRFGALNVLLNIILCFLAFLLGAFLIKFIKAL
jgi:fluoride exporter